MAWDDIGGKGRSGRPEMPDLEELFSQFRRRLGISKIPWVTILGVAVLLIWLASGIYIVAPAELGVVQRFGRYIRTTTSGPHYHLPYPIEKVTKPKVTQVRRLEVGFRTIALVPTARYQHLPNEALMLTRDENIIDIQFIVQYNLKDPVKYLFNVFNVTKAVKGAAEASMREVIGKTNIDDALTIGKFKIQQDTKKLLQRILDNYEMGVNIVAVQLQDVHPPQQVAQAFKDVASAREDRERAINNAQGYRNDILPKAKGEAARIINEAEAYKEAVLKKAEGETSHFLQVLKEYRSAKDITRQRLFLETMEEILPSMNKIIIEGAPSSNLLQLLPLGEWGGEKGGRP
ncbi:MAG: FtsH protease activity modulator HflK [Deltaproteobacteria bacterium]|nr:FtsH protease activity modulator HflK [Deltaproteobacteria bacterium]